MLQDLDNVQVMTEVEVSEMLFEHVDMIEKKVSFQFNSHIKKNTILLLLLSSSSL